MHRTETEVVVWVWSGVGYFVFTFGVGGEAISAVSSAPACFSWLVCPSFLVREYVWSPICNARVCGLACEKNIVVKRKEKCFAHSSQSCPITCDCSSKVGVGLGVDVISAGDEISLVVEFSSLDSCGEREVDQIYF